MSSFSPRTAVRRRTTALLALLLTILAVAMLAPPTADAATSTVKGTQSGRCLDVPGSANASGTAVIVWDCHGGTNQRWTRTSTDELRIYA